MHETRQKHQYPLGHTNRITTRRNDLRRVVSRFMTRRIFGYISTGSCIHAADTGSKRDACDTTQGRPFVGLIRKVVRYSYR